MTGGIHKVAGGRTIRWLAAETPFFQRLEKDFPMAGKPFAPRKVRAVRKRMREGRGRASNIETHENHFADMERGREADVQSGRGRPAREYGQEKWRKIAFRRVSI